jgi:uncharacterized protein (DUF2225 family)
MLNRDRCYIQERQARLDEAYFTQLNQREDDREFTEEELVSALYFFLNDEKQNELVWLNTLEQSFWRI